MGKAKAGKKVFQSLSKIMKKDLPQIDEVRAKQIAKAYDDMVHNPNDPEVAKAYDALINETEQQYIDLIKNKGLKVSPIKPDMENPYKTSQDLIKDVQENKHMWYFPTEQGFGSSGADVSNNPLLRATGQTIDGKPMPANDLFRIVHDYYGHTEPKFSFGPRGEEGAFREHSKMFSPEAQKALTTETRGQNSWVNYGPYGEANRANPAQTKYADQKTGILPDWARDISDPEGTPVVAYGKKGQLDSTQFEEFKDSPQALPGVEKYSTRIKGKVYDLSKDPLKILDQTKSPEEAKLLAQKEGFDAISYFKDGQKKYETFQPVSMRPSYGVIGALGAGAALSSPSESEASMGKFQGLKKMWQLGDKSFPAANAAEAMKVKQAMEAQGMVEPGRALVQADAPTPVANKTLPNMARGMAVAPGFESGSDVLRSGFKGLKDAFGTYRENVVEPVSNKLKETLTPKLNIQGQQYDTASPVSDMALDIAADPLTYAGGGAGTALGALDMATSLGEETPKQKYEGLKSILNKK